MRRHRQFKIACGGDVLERHDSIRHLPRSVALSSIQSLAASLLLSLTSRDNTTAPITNEMNASRTN